MPDGFFNAFRQVREGRPTRFDLVFWNCRRWRKCIRQGTIELGSLIPEQNVLEVVEFEPISEEELLMWRVLRQYEAIGSIADKIVAADLADAIKPYQLVKSVSPTV